MEGSTSTIQSAITSMATTVATDGVNMLIAVVPVLAPIVGAVIVAGLGYKFVKNATLSLRMSSPLAVVRWGGGRTLARPAAPPSANRDLCRHCAYLEKRLTNL